MKTKVFFIMLAWVVLSMNLKAQTNDEFSITILNENGQEVTIKPGSILEIEDARCDLNQQPCEEIDGVVIEAVKGQKTWEQRLVKISSWPEFKTETCYKWVDMGWPIGRVKVPYPCVYKRTCNKSFYVRILYPADAGQDIEGAIKDCTKTAAIVAIPFLLAGQVGPAAGAFSESFKSCMIAKGVSMVSKFQISIISKKTCSGWSRV